jgi:hypothetical protein
MSRQTDFDQLSSSAPVNRSSAMVTSGGVHWEPGKQSVGKAPGYIRSDTPLPTQPWPHNAPRLAGKRFGRFTVVGYGGRSAHAARYVVRCDCGAYEHRRMKALQGDVSRLMCAHCDYLEQLKLGKIERLA